jgi:glutamyl-tRNA reductase
MVMDGHPELDIHVCGIDHDTAPQSCREVFLLDRDRCQDAAVTIRTRMNAAGCVVLSTCNRTEVWVQGGQGGDPYRAFCNALSIPRAQYEQYFYHRSGDAVARYLFELACGMHSALFGEDQIIPQISRAAAWAREVGCSGPVLERLFRDAVTVAKQVRTAVRLSEADETVVRHVRTLMLDFLHIDTLRGVPVLIIGSGEMARMLARLLVEDGASVTMTIRDMEKASALIPEGCNPAPFERRLDLLGTCSLVVSATAGLYHTLDLDSIAPRLTDPTLFIDLAMPVDIDPRVADLSGATLIGLRDLDCDRPRRDAAVAKAEMFIDSRLAEFFEWHVFRGAVPLIQRLAGDAAGDTLWRLQRPLRRLGLSSEQFHEICGAIFDSSRKAFAHQLYGLRHTEGNGPDKFPLVVKKSEEFVD